MRVILGELDDERRHILGETVVVGGIVREQHFPDPGDLGRGFCHRVAVFPGHQDVDVLASDFLGRGDGVEGRGL